jgi:hypothetical protein
MPKRVITPVSQNASVPSQAWLDVESAAVVEVTSEDTAYPIESAVLLAQKRGWRPQPTAGPLLVPIAAI